MTTNIEKITKDGFSLADRNQKLKNLALVSLKIALQAFFSTYKEMKNSLHLFDSKQMLPQGHIDFNHSNDYCKHCAEAIVHFQHFAELVCKDFLRSEHDLLAIDASCRPEIFHKLLKKEAINEQEYETLNTVEFGEALKRLCTLIKKGRIGMGSLDFILEAQDFLMKLNGLRNREWHRGAYILRYPALDKLVGECPQPTVLPVRSLFPL